MSLAESHAFSGFSVDNYGAAKDFYSLTLGLEVEEDQMGLHLKLDGGNEVFIYAKPDHKPATFTILNFAVDDIDATVEDLTSQGVTFEWYEGMNQDDTGIARGKEAGMGPDIAWFKDPAGNILAVLEN